MSFLAVTFKIAARIFKRDSKRGDLLLLILSMSIAVASISVIFLLVERFEAATNKEVADVLGADLVITSPQELPSDWLDMASQNNLQQATSVEFSSVLFANEKLQLASIQAVSSNYPLRGQIEISQTPYATQKQAVNMPPLGELWVEPRIYNSLNLTQTSQIELGYTHLKLGGVIALKPGQGSTLFNIAPAAIINLDDLDKTKVVQPGSRIVYRYLFAGEPESINQYAAKIKPLLSSSQRLVTVFDESPIAGSAISRSKKYISLSTLLTMILLGLTVALAANRYAHRQFDLSALMRCFGLNRAQVFSVFSFILIFVCVTGIALGASFGILFEAVLVESFAESVVKQLPAANYKVLLLPFVAATLLLFGFAFPSLLQIQSVPPMRVLRRQLAPMSLKSWGVYALAAATLVFVMWLQMQNLKLLLSVLLGLVGVAFVFALIAALLLKAATKLPLIRSPEVKFSIRQLNANRSFTLMHLLSFSITLFVIALVILVKSELLSKWQQSLGDNVPNHFLVNVKPQDVKPLETFFEQNNLTFSGLYPMVRGRITGINGVDVKQAVEEKSLSHNSLRRELNMTWAQQLPLGNQVVGGRWQWQAENDSAQISIEQKTADALQLKIGDKLNFNIGSEPWDAEIVSIRSIDWQTFTPNFYVISNPGALDKFNATYIASFKLSLEQKPLLAKIVSDYPSVSIIELDAILAEIQSIIEKISRAIEVIMLFVVAAGLALLWAAMEHTFDSKYKQSAILRTLGASKQFISKSFRFEYFWLGVLSSIMAIMAIELVSFVLYRFIFEIEFEFHWSLWAVLPVATVGFMLIASWQGVKRVTKPSPITLLRQNS
ncbi:ABC transporter permease [Aliikangiella sp. IMCC44653]